MVLNWYYSRMNESEPLLLGIDGGGTGCRAILATRSGHTIGTGTAGPANIMTDFDTARANILSAVGQAFTIAEKPMDEVRRSRAILGLAGANIGTYAKRMERELPFAECKIVTDALIALHGAIGNRDGAAAIIGTGSVFICRQGRTVRTVGGWGFTVGDLGSGARLGRELLEETLQVFDGIHQGSELTQIVLKRFQHNPQTIVEYAHEAKPGQFGELTPLIFEYAELGDETALNLIDKAVQSIEETLAVISPDNKDPICLLGGLGSKYERYLHRDFVDKLVAPAGLPVDGALSLALQEYSEPAGIH